MAERTPEEIAAGLNCETCGKRVAADARAASVECVECFSRALAQDMTPAQRAWLLDLAELGPHREDRRGNRNTAVTLNPLLGASSGCEGPDVVCVDYGSPRARTWDLTPLGRQVAEVLSREGGKA